MVEGVELRQLEAFVAVAAELHFGRAATRLHVGQPTVSELVRRLEREMGTPLLTRTTRRVTLTDAGAELYERASAIIDDVASAAAAVHRFAEGEFGAVRVGITPPVAPVLAPHLAGAMHAEAPGVEVSIRRMWLPDLLRAVVEHEVDVAITCGPVAAPPAALSQTICGEPLLVALRPTHRLAGRLTVDLSELAEDTLGIPSSELFPAWSQAQRHALRVAGLSPPMVELSDTDLAARRWPAQAEVDWILTTASVAARDMAATIRPLTHRNLLPYLLHWAPGYSRNPAVGRFVRLAHTTELPEGWTRLTRPHRRRDDVSA
jgi:DNA-binding transcriptional LysR family regulator